MRPLPSGAPVAAVGPPGASAEAGAAEAHGLSRASGREETAPGVATSGSSSRSVKAVGLKAVKGGGVGGKRAEQGGGKETQKALRGGGGGGRKGSVISLPGDAFAGEAAAGGGATPRAPLRDGDSGSGGLRDAQSRQGTPGSVPGDRQVSVGTLHARLNSHHVHVLGARSDLGAPPRRSAAGAFVGALVMTHLFLLAALVLAYLRRRAAGPSASKPDAPPKKVNCVYEFDSVAGSRPRGGRLTSAKAAKEEE